jgi:hypothetical protein
MHDLVFEGATVIDGSGQAARTADVGIKNGLIAEIGRITGQSQQRVDASGAWLTPGFVDIHTHGDYPSVFTFGNGWVVLALDGIHFCDDRRGMRLDDLASIFEIHLVAIVFWGIVAGREVDPGLGFDVTDGEGKLRSRSRTLEKISVATEFGDDFGGQFGELAREKSGIMAETDRWFSRAALLGEVIFDIQREPLRGSADVVLVHRIRSHAGKLRAS